MKRKEAPGGFEPPVEVLQTSALPLGYGAGARKEYGIGTILPPQAGLSPAEGLERGSGAAAFNDPFTRRELIKKTRSKRPSKALEPSLWFVMYRRSADHTHTRIRDSIGRGWRGATLELRIRGFPKSDLSNDARAPNNGPIGVGVKPKAL
jgi:hypothetical protein